MAQTKDACMAEIPPDLEFSIRATYFTFTFLWGACTGSLLNVVIFRLPENLSLIAPPSMCPHCGNRITLIELFPIINYIFLKGRCRHCSARISARYPLVELLTASICGAIGYHNAFKSFTMLENALVTMSDLMLAAFLIACFFIGADRGKTYLRLTLPGMAAGLALSSAFQFMHSQSVSIQTETAPELAPIVSAIYGTALGACFAFLACYVINLLCRTTSDAESGQISLSSIALGDASLGAMAGAFMGLEKLANGCIYAVIICIIWQITARLGHNYLEKAHRGTDGHGHNTTFSPFCAAGCIMAIFVQVA
ncbi:MAG: prepilin peptidase [Planctomycetes bacterium]|nr:prepilin peptidase [Planctomycetota bacterium]